MENYSKNAFIPIFKIKKSIKKNLQLQIAITFLKEVSSKAFPSLNKTLSPACGSW